jgi:hypothetical protein
MKMSSKSKYIKTLGKKYGNGPFAVILYPPDYSRIWFMAIKHDGSPCRPIGKKAVNIAKAYISSYSRKMILDVENFISDLDPKDSWERSIIEDYLRIVFGLSLLFSRKKKRGKKHKKISV